MTAQELRARMGPRLGGALAADDARLLARAARSASFRTGAVLWRAGAPGRGLHLLLEGRVRLVRSRRGRQHLVHVAEPGALMGEVPIFSDAPYPATAIAASSGRVLVLAAADVRAVAGRNGAFATLLLEGVSRRVAHLVARLERQTLGDVRARLAASLVGMAAGEPDGLARVAGTREEWAEDLGTVREVLARELRRMRESGLVEPAGRRAFRLLRADELERLALDGASPP